MIVSIRRSVAIIMALGEFARASSQYCQQDALTHVHFCVAADTWYNQSSSSTDLLVTFGSQTVDGQGGWTATGLGSGMLGSLIFALYSDKKKVPTLSVRHGRGHFEPRPDASLPQVHISSLSLNSSNWIEASFTCYGYDKWVSIDKKTASQPFIWAANPAAVIGTASVDTKLDIHESYGQFSLKFQNAGVKNSKPELPVIDFVKSEDDSKGTKGQVKEKPHMSKSFIFALHGFLMALAFMVLYPAGAIAIRSESHNPFMAHVLCQVLATTLCFVGAGIAIVVITGQGMAFWREPHVLIGLLLVILVIAQIIMGYLHHLAYKRGRGASIFTSVHRVLGRSLILGGCVNAFLGLRLVSFTRLTFVVFASVSLIDLLIMAALWYISSKDGRPTETTDEDKTPFLDEPETT